MLSCRQRCGFHAMSRKNSVPSSPGLMSPTLSTHRLRALYCQALFISAKISADGVVFTGGEPTLRRDLPELVSFARDAGYETIQIQTNGRTFASRRYCETIIEAGATEFSPALHGHVPELHDFLTRAPGSFAQTTRGIRNLKSLGQYVLTNSVVVRANCRNLAQLAHLLVTLGVDQYQLAFYTVGIR